VNLDIRELSDEKDLDRALKVFFASMVGLALPGSDTSVLEFVEAGRPLGLFRPGADGEPEMVGTAGSFTSRLTVPGGARIPMSAVTDVGVLPTHTRQGLASALLRHQLEQAAGRGEIVATLRASEATIYERFGYGVASALATVEVDVTRAKLRPTVPAPAPIVAERPVVRFVDPESCWELMARLYPTRTQAGTIERPRLWWRSNEHWATQSKDPWYVVAHGAPGAEDGFVRYRPTSTGHWFTAADRTIVVDDFVTTTPQAYLGLLRFLFSVDLLQKVRFARFPVDHALEKLVLDERAVRTVETGDETWLRLVDVQAALSARTYTGSGAVTIAVTDDLRPVNTGRYRVSADGVERTEAAADLSLGVAALATVYLGGTRWWQLEPAGRVVEHTAGAIDIADALFATPRLPFAGTMF
jgi:predicted acetyltransferase